MLVWGRGGGLEREPLNPEDTLISAWLQGHTLRKQRKKEKNSLGERKECKEIVQDYYK